MDRISLGLPFLRTARDTNLLIYSQTPNPVIKSLYDGFFSILASMMDRISLGLPFSRTVRDTNLRIYSQTQNPVIKSLHDGFVLYSCQHDG